MFHTYQLLRDKKFQGLARFLFLKTHLDWSLAYWSGKCQVLSDINDCTYSQSVPELFQLQIWVGICWKVGLNRFSGSEGIVNLFVLTGKLRCGVPHYKHFYRDSNAYFKEHTMFEYDYFSLGLPRMFHTHTQNSLFWSWGGRDLHVYLISLL